MDVDNIAVKSLGYPQRAKRALRGRLHPALPVEGATQAPVIDRREDV